RNGRSAGGGCSGRSRKPSSSLRFRKRRPPIAWFGRANCANLRPTREGEGRVMKRFVPVVLLALAFSTVASAGAIYGKSGTGAGAVPAGTPVAAKCGDKSYPAVSTDKTGSYHLVVAETGKCTLTITLGGQAASLQVISYAQGSQADIVLETAGGKLS